MFERLFKRKNVFSYIPAFLAAFCSLTVGINPFSSAVFAVMVEEKIPVLITFLFTSIVQLVLFGYVDALRFLTFAVIYSLIKAFAKNKQKYNDKDIIDVLSYFTIRVLFASLISEGLLLLTGIEEITNLANAIYLVIAIATFSIVFMYGYKYYFNLIKENEEQIKFMHMVSFLIMCVVCTSIIKEGTVFGINIWAFLTIVFLMIIVWKKNIVFGILSSLLVSLIIVLCANISFGIIMLTLVTAVVTVLLSKANRKGALIGLVFSFLALGVITIHNSSNNFGFDERMQKDYYEYLNSSKAFLSGEELEKTNEEINRMDMLVKVQEASKNTLSNMVVRCMIVGFFVLCVIPIKCLEYINQKIPDAPSTKQITERLFRINKIYRLNPGKEEKEKEE